MKKQSLAMDKMTKIKASIIGLIIGIVLLLLCALVWLTYSTAAESFYSYGILFVGIILGYYIWSRSKSWVNVLYSVIIFLIIVLSLPPLLLITGLMSGTLEMH